MADATMADAGEGAAAPRPSAKKGAVDYAALEADVQAQLQVAAQARAPAWPERRPSPNASAVPCRAASPRRLRLCSTSRRRSAW